jgi:copper/silver efflux system protein
VIERIIELSARHRWIIFCLTAGLIVWSVIAMRQTPLDAVPDLSDPQVIVFTDWMGRSPDLVEDRSPIPSFARSRVLPPCARCAATRCLG